MPEDDSSNHLAPLGALRKALWQLTVRQRRLGRIALKARTVHGALHAMTSSPAKRLMTDKIPVLSFIEYVSRIHIRTFDELKMTNENLYFNHILPRGNRRSTY